MVESQESAKFELDPILDKAYFLKFLFASKVGSIYIIFLSYLHVYPAWFISCPKNHQLGTLITNTDSQIL
jgi:hypothetical protein